MVLSESELFQLKKMIEMNDTSDQTQEIRSLKHSKDIRDSVKNLMKLKIDRRELFLSDKDTFEVEALSVAGFLFHNYFQLYNQILKEDIDMTIMDKFLDVLSQIEDGVVDQHEGSFIVGKILKEMYIDGKVREMGRLDDLSESTKPIKNSGKELTWKQYKPNLSK